MTPQQAHTDVERHNTPPEHTPRLRLKPKAPQSGYVDGAWWPRSDDLATELPDLLAVLSVRLGRIDRVMYNLNEWAKASAKLVTGGRRYGSTGTDVSRPTPSKFSGSTATRLPCWWCLANADPDEAHATLMAAAAPSNDSTVDSLLTIN